MPSQVRTLTWTRVAELPLHREVSAFTEHDSNLTLKYDCHIEASSRLMIGGE